MVTHPHHCHAPSLIHIFVTQLCHTHLRHTPSFVTRTVLSHTIFHTQSFTHTHLCHTPSLTHTIFHTHLCQTPSLTHILVTHPHHCHTPSLTHIFVTQLCHTHLCHTPLYHTHTPFLAHTTLSQATLSCTIFHAHTCLLHAITHTIFYTQPCHTSSWSHTTLHIQLFNWSILHHLLCLSFLPHPTGIFVWACWKKLTCGVIRSFNLRVSAYILLLSPFMFHVLYFLGSDIIPRSHIEYGWIWSMCQIQRLFWIWQLVGKGPFSELQFVFNVKCSQKLLNFRGLCLW